MAFEMTTGLRKGSSYLHELECLRGVAILLVILFHAHGLIYGVVAKEYGLLMSFVIAGNTGVTLFFVLSGFLLSLPWLKFLEGQGPQPRLKSFYIARALRILPLYLVTLFAAVSITGNFIPAGKALFFWPVGMEMFPFSVVWWTLSTEVQFYLLMPLGFLCWSHGKRWRLLVIALALLWIAAYVGLVINKPVSVLHQWEYLLNKSLFGRLPAFAIGIFCAWLHVLIGQHSPSLERNTACSAISFILLIGLIYCLGRVLILVALKGDFVAESEWHIHHTYEALLWSGIMLVLLHTPLPFKNLLINFPLALAGKLSYSLYLIHVPVLFYLGYSIKADRDSGHVVSSGSVLSYSIAGFLISLALSGLTYKLIEKPFLNIKKRIPVN